MSEPIRLFVGTSANGQDAEAEMVLEFTARKHCSLPLDITWMRQAASGPYSGWASSANNRTPFSSFRWSPPAVCGYQGRAIYTDVDFFFLADLAELWAQDIPGDRIMAMKGPDGKLSNSACILFDCAKCKGHLPDLKHLKAMPDAHEQMLAYLRPRKDQLIQGLEGDWNCKAYEKLSQAKPIPPLDLSKAKAYHFTRIEHQLHLHYAIPRLKTARQSHWYTGPVSAHPHQELVAFYDGLYRDALDAGYTVDQYRVESFAGATRNAFTYKQHRGGVPS